MSVWAATGDPSASETDNRSHLERDGGGRGRGGGGAAHLRIDEFSLVFWRCFSICCTTSVIPSCNEEWRKMRGAKHCEIAGHKASLPTKGTRTYTHTHTHTHTHKHKQTHRHASHRYKKEREGLKMIPTGD